MGGHPRRAMSKLVERTSFHGAQIAAAGIDAATALLTPFHECAMSEKERRTVGASQAAMIAACSSRTTAHERKPR